MNEERDFYDEVRSLLQEWNEDGGEDVDTIRDEVNEIVDNLE